MDFLKHMGQRIKGRILRSGYQSIELFAHEHDIPKSTLSEILNGKNDPRLTTLAKICSGLEIPLSELFQDPAIELWVRDSAPKYHARRPASGRKGAKEISDRRT